MEELAGQVRILQHKLEQAEKMMKESKESSQVVVHNTREKKIPTFREGDDIDEWIAATKIYVDNRFTSEPERVNFIIEHLTKGPKTEVRFRIDETKATTTELFELLKNIYGIKESLLELQQAFYSRDQRDDESLDAYSQDLMSQLLVLRKQEPSIFKDTDSILKQRFAEGVKHKPLKRELRRLNTERKQLKFYEVRDWAKTWMKDIDTEEGATSESTHIDLLMKTVAEQQKQMMAMQEKIIATENKQAEAQAQFTANRGRPWRGGFRRSRGRGSDIPSSNTNTPVTVDNQQHQDVNQLVCHYCNQPNHIQRNCLKKRQDGFSMHRGNYRGRYQRYQTRFSHQPAHQPRWTYNNSPNSGSSQQFYQPRQSYNSMSYNQGYQSTDYHNPETRSQDITLQTANTSSHNVLKDTTNYQHSS